MFITFEGPDGSGKSTALKSLTELFDEMKIKYILTREPGSPHSEESKKIREIITNKDSKLPNITEALLFAADRRMHLDNIINPALAEGKIVLCDRYIDSSLAYQGAGRQIGIDVVKQINELATEKQWPDLTIFFDIKPLDSEKRVDERAEKDRLELAGKDFHGRVYDGYMEVLKMFPERIISVDASRSREEVFEEVKKIVLNSLK